MALRFMFRVIAEQAWYWMRRETQGQKAALYYRQSWEARDIAIRLVMMGESEQAEAMVRTALHLRWQGALKETEGEPDHIRLKYLTRDMGEAMAWEHQMRQEMLQRAGRLH